MTDNIDQKAAGVLTTICNLKLNSNYGFFKSKADSNYGISFGLQPEAFIDDTNLDQTAKDKMLQQWLDANERKKLRLEFLKNNERMAFGDNVYNPQAKLLIKAMIEKDRVAFDTAFTSLVEDTTQYVTSTEEIEQSLEMQHNLMGKKAPEQFADEQRETYKTKATGWIAADAQEFVRFIALILEAKSQAEDIKSRISDVPGGEAFISVNDALIRRLYPRYSEISLCPTNESLYSDTMEAFASKPLEAEKDPFNDAFWKQKSMIAPGTTLSETQTISTQARNDTPPLSNK